MKKLVMAILMGLIMVSGLSAQTQTKILANKYNNQEVVGKGTKEDKIAKQVYKAAIKSGKLKDLKIADRILGANDLFNHPEITGGALPSKLHSKEFNDVRARLKKLEPNAWPRW